MHAASRFMCEKIIELQNVSRRSINKWFQNPAIYYIRRLHYRPPECASAKMCGGPRY
jgi:hypothetical protein